MDARSEVVDAGGRRGLSRAFWATGIALSLALVWLARYRPSWPWFSLWVLGLLALLGILALPRVRRSLNLSWFGVTLLILTGTALFDLYLFHVETHRQRSERLEVRGVYLAPDVEPVRVGVGRDDLDVRLEGSLYDFDRWAVDIRRLDGRRFAVTAPSHVDMLRVRAPEGWWPGARSTTPALGASLSGGRPMVSWADARGDTARLELLREGPRGTLSWEGARAPLNLEDPLLDRRLSRRLSLGIPLAELPWDSLPDGELAADLVLTRTVPGRSLGRLLLSLPHYRVVSRSRGEALADTTPPALAPGDTVWVTSRGKTWAFSLDLVPGVSRVAAPLAVGFVRRPRPAGWALPSGEACGSASHRCAVLSTRALPPPQPHFDLSGFGLDTARYSVLARLEADGEGVRVVSARRAATVAYDEVHPLPALAADGDDSPTGILMAVTRDAQGRQSAVLATVGTLYLMILGALLVLSGDARLWARRKEESPHMTAAWGFLNVFLIFLGVRLALGLRVAYTPPFYDRAAATGVGLWITFATMLVALGRWSSWVPAFWRLAARVERPLSRMFVPGRNGRSTSMAPPSAEGAPGHEAHGDDPAGRPPAGRARLRTFVGLVVFLGSMGYILWQRPEAVAALVVSAVGIGAWLAMGVTRLGVSSEMSTNPVGVITTRGGEDSALASFAVAAGASVVLVLAIHAPELALVPVLVLLGLFGLNHAVGWTGWAQHPARRGWVLYVAFLALLGVGVAAFSPWPTESAAALAVVATILGSWLARKAAESDAPRVSVYFKEFMDLRDALFSGVGWLGVLMVLGALVFLKSQEIPPFVRFALDFMLFLLAIRAG